MPIMTKDQKREEQEPTMDASITLNSFMRRIALKIRKILPILKSRKDLAKVTFPNDEPVDVRMVSQRESKTRTQSKMFQDMSLLQKKYIRCTINFRTSSRV
mmetsp:Transcript_68608/g.180938  ORF Transcript_68608/g.180938 Transcript_68608/m.180938 type:complete len:101 (-) Transcript_68608:1172-1474(-)